MARRAAASPQDDWERARNKNILPRNMKLKHTFCSYNGCFRFLLTISIMPSVVRCIHYYVITIYIAMETFRITGTVILRRSRAIHVCVLTYDLDNLALTMSFKHSVIPGYIRRIFRNGVILISPKASSLRRN